jgi:large subunit ribosomal protein L21
LEEVKEMFAIVQSGGKQYKVCENDIISVEKLDNAVGDKVTLDVMLISDNGTVVAGNPIVAGAVCEAEVVAHGKGDKIVVFKYKPKKNERKKQGHRQPFTQIKILSIKK